MRNTCPYLTTHTGIKIPGRSTGTKYVPVKDRIVTFMFRK